MSWRRFFKTLAILVFVFLVTQYALGPSIVPSSGKNEDVRAYTRPIEFNYGSWMADAMLLKIGQVALGLPEYMQVADQKQTVLDYLALVNEIQAAEFELENIFADPSIADPEAASVELRAHLEELYKQRELLGPLAESILQNQVATIAAEAGLTLGGQPVPPVLYHSTPLPWALIVSPRDIIRQDGNISLEVETTLEDQIALENQVESNLNLSALVVPVGGIGAYPTMVAQTTNLNWLAEVIAHEWTHNYLTLRPLGVLYDETPELRTMNETTASIAGNEIGAALIERYYPEFAPPPPAPAPEPEEKTEAQTEPPPELEVPVFDFRAEMRETRVTTDALLAEGKIEEAEAYMEARRVFLWENGYRIRRLNQAYFAFHGAYADQPGGAAGDDPVGAAVRELRAGSTGLADFINRMSWMISYTDLQKAVGTQANGE